LLNAGASDVFAWNNCAEPARESPQGFERWNQIDQIVRSPLVENNLAGKTAAWVRCLTQLVEVASFTNSSVLITGKVGLGRSCLRN